MKPLSFVLPESFHPGEFLIAPELRGRCDDARYVVSLILTKMAQGDVDCVRLHAKYLRNIMYQATYAAVMAALLAGGVLRRAPYQVGEKSFGYQLADRFSGDRHVRVPATDGRLIGRLQSFAAENQIEQQKRWQPVHQALAEQQRRLGVHGDQACDWLMRNADCNKFDTQSILVRDIEDGEFRLSVGQYDRVFNSISNLKRELRPFLHVDGEPLGSVDIRCCQPALIARLFAVRSQHHQTTTDKEGRGVSNYDSSGWIPDHYDSSGMKATNRDVRLYQSLVESGELYDVLKIEALRRGVAIDRDEVKRQLMCDVIAKRGKYPSRVVEQVFGDLFPTVLKFIWVVNQQDHGNLIRQLHREEARLVIETVAADLVARFPGVFFLTLHDAIYATAEHLPKVEQAFDRVFRQTGFTMALKTEYPNVTAMSPRKKSTSSGTESAITMTSRHWSRDRDQGGVTTLLRCPEFISIGLGFRWPRMMEAV